MPSISRAIDKSAAFALLCALLVSCAAHDTNQSVDRIRTIGKGTYLVETLDVHRSREFGAQHSDDYQVSGISRFAYVLSPDQTRGGYTARLYAKSGKLPARAALDLYLSSRRRQYLPPSPAEYTAMRQMGAECTDSSPKLVEEGFRTDTTATFFCRQHIVTVDFNSGNACFFDLTSWLPRTEARPVPASLPDISTIESIKPRQDSHVTLDSYLHIQSAGKSGVFVYLKPEVLRGRSETSIDRIAKWGGMGLIRRIDICGKSATERAVNVAADEYIAAFDPSRGGLVMASKLLDEKGDTFRFLASDGTVTKRSATEVGSPESPFPANYVLDANRNLLLTVEDAGGTFVVVEHPLAAQENYGRTFVVDKPR